MVGAKLAENATAQNMDHSVMQDVPVAELYLRKCPPEEQGSDFWDGFEEAALEMPEGILSEDEAST